MRLTPDADRLRLRFARWAAGAGLALIATMLWLGLATGSGGGPEPGTPAPAFDLALLDGGRVASADLAGRVTVLNVWASWCPPCREEAPALRRAHEASDPARVAFLGIVYQDSAGDARAFVGDFGIGYPNAVDDGTFASAYGIRGIPVTIVLAADGTTVARHFGPIGEARLRVLIDDALARSASASAAAAAPAASPAAAVAP